MAHESEVAYITVNPEGTLICTASIKGTKLKVFSADSGETLQVLRRGSSNALITSIVFHPTLNILACCSSKSSIHLFSTKVSVTKCIENKQYGFNQATTSKGADLENKKPSLGFLKSVSKFFDNDLCLSKIKIDDKLKTIAFDDKNKRLAIMSYDRIMYYLDVPAEQMRHIPEAEVRTF